MIVFANKKVIKPSSISQEYKVIEEKNISVGRYLEILSYKGNVAIDNFQRSIRLTNKGGHRLINYIKSSESTKADNLYIFYDPVDIKYLIKTCPEKLSNYSEFGGSPLVEILSDERISLISYRDGEMVPFKFDSDSSLFEWILEKDSKLCAKIFNEIHDLKSKQDSKKDVMYFSNNSKSLEEVEKRYGLSKLDVTKAFLKYTI